MLLGGKQSEIKQVAIVTRNEQFNRVFGSILADWRFFVVEDPAQANVLFVERGLTPPDVDAMVVWLTPMPLTDGSFLQVPISLTRLYHLLEVHFFPTPRRHIRVAMEASVDLAVDGGWMEGRLISLSDRGGRIVSSVEVPRGKLFSLEMKLDDKHLIIPAEVLYCIPAGDSPNRAQPQIGVLFKPKDKQETVALRHYIEKVTIQAACVREGIAKNDPGLSWLEVPENPWQD
jgi:hypothetical protein